MYTLRLAEEMVSDGIWYDKGPFGFGSALEAFLKYLKGAILPTDVWIMDVWITCVWKYMYMDHIIDIILVEK